MTLVDTHCHLDFHQFDADRAEVIERAVRAGLNRILVPAIDRESAIAAVRLSAAHSMVYAAAGFHPTDADKWQADSLAILMALFSSPESAGKLVAVGEIGLDYYWVQDPQARLRQRQLLETQLSLAREVSRPVILHMREEGDAWHGGASEDLLAILTSWHGGLAREGHPLASRPGVLHSFNGTTETAERALGLNFCIGVTGPVTYKNASQKREVIRSLPLERLLLETDAPFLTPVPHRGKRNEPAYIPHIADKIAEIHSKDPAEIAALTSANAARLFAWGD